VQHQLPWWDIEIETALAGGCHHTTAVSGRLNKNKGEKCPPGEI